MSVLLKVSFQIKEHPW